MSDIPSQVDVVVIGSGVSGLTAALTAAEAGKRVIIFEKLKSLFSVLSIDDCRLPKYLSIA